MVARTGSVATRLLGDRTGVAGEQTAMACPRFVSNAERGSTRAADWAAFTLEAEGAETGARGLA